LFSYRLVSGVSLHNQLVFLHGLFQLDLEGVNYSSIRAGVLEDREIFKGLQDWFIRSLVMPVFDEWVDFNRKLKFSEEYH